MDILKTILIVTVSIIANVAGGAYAWSKLEGRDLKRKVKRYRTRIELLNYQSEIFKHNYLKAVENIYKERRMRVEKQAEYKTESSTKDKQLEVINHYGMNKQLDQLIEESGELIVAIAKNKRYSRPGSSLSHYENLVEELADVKNLIEQIEQQSPYIKEGIEVMVKHKTEREIERIRRNKNE